MIKKYLFLIIILILNFSCSSVRVSSSGKVQNDKLGKIENVTVTKSCDISTTKAILSGWLTLGALHFLYAQQCKNESEEEVKEYVTQKLGKDYFVGKISSSTVGWSSGDRDIKVSLIEDYSALKMRNVKNIRKLKVGSKISSVEKIIGEADKIESKNGNEIHKYDLNDGIHSSSNITPYVLVYKKGKLFEYYIDKQRLAEIKEEERNQELIALEKEKHNLEIKRHNASVLNKLNQDMQKTNRSMSSQPSSYQSPNYNTCTADYSCPQGQRCLKKKNNITGTLEMTGTCGTVYHLGN